MEAGRLSMPTADGFGVTGLAKAITHTCLCMAVEADASSGLFLLRLLCAWHCRCPCIGTSKVEGAQGGGWAY